MAAIQQRKGSFRVQFNFRGKQFGFIIGRVSEAEAQFKASEIDYLLMRLKQGLIEVPPGADVVEFFRHNGAPPARPRESGPAARKELTLGDLRDRYLETHGNGSLEVHTIKGIRRHFGHLTRALGEGFPIRSLKLADLQGYIDKRGKAKGRRGPLLATTIKKEIVTLRTAWKWGERMGITEGRCPVDGLRYAKGDEKPPFQSRAEIERQLPGLPKEKASERPGLCPGCLGLALRVPLEKGAAWRLPERVTSSIRAWSIAMMAACLRIRAINSSRDPAWSGRHHSCPTT